MNIINKTILALSLTLAIPLSTQANWLSDLKDNILGKKKTIAASVTLGSALSYLALKLVDYRYESPIPAEFNPDPSFIQFAGSVSKQNFRPGMEGLASMIKGVACLDPKIKRPIQLRYVCAALGITAGLIYIAHKRNIFGENSKIQDLNK